MFNPNWLSVETITVIKDARDQGAISKAEMIDLIRRGLGLSTTEEDAPNAN